MNIITKVPKMCDGEIDRAFMREIRTGFKMEKATQEGREAIARKEARDESQNDHPVLGKRVAVIPPREFFRLTAKYGHETVHSPEFLRYYHKKHKDMSPYSA